MKFFSSKITTKKVSLEEAAQKATSAKQVRSLDELLAEAKTSNVKTASADATVKVASTEAAPADAPKTEEKVAEKASNVEVKTAGFEEFIKEKKEEKKDEDDGVVEVKDEEKKEDKKPDFLKKDDEKKEKESCNAAAKVTLKVAKSHDFRNWKAEEVIKAWKQHGTVEACKKSVQKFVSDPCTYCNLLHVASVEADKVLKTASTNKAAAPKSKMTMIAKLSKEDRDMLAKYFTQIYGKEYVDALLEDY